MARGYLITSMPLHADYVVIQVQKYRTTGRTLRPFEAYVRLMRCSVLSDLSPVTAPVTR